jgi:mannose-6-phosphate isomerase class I
MDGFTLLHPVRVGDVFQVPRLLPHALQHGVRVIEFQTPSYERKIVSYAQKVLTQDRWDSREAVAQMRLAAPAGAAPRPVFYSPGLAVEQIVDFPDFEVQRVTLQAGRHWQLEAGASYALLMVVAGTLELAASRYGPEQAVLLPRLWRGIVRASGHSVPLVLLLARPRPRS